MPYKIAKKKLKSMLGFVGLQIHFCKLKLQSALIAFYRLRWRLRSKNRKREGYRLRVVFLIHSPQISNKLRPLIDRMLLLGSFDVRIIGMRYRHDVTSGGVIDENPYQYFYCRYGEIVKSEICVPPKSLKQADYIFVQTPYEIYDKSFNYSRLSMYSRICYVPYHGPLIYSGEVEKITKPERFGLYAHAIYVHPLESNYQDCALRSSFDKKSIPSGSPMFENISLHPKSLNKVKKILWTPRWTTMGGHCSYYENIDVLTRLAACDNEIEIRLRAHPLFILNMKKAGQTSESHIESLKNRLKSIPNFVIDNSLDLEEEIEKCDLFISDMSSAIVEIISSSKPLIYYHKNNSFNHLGMKIAEACYWACSPKELIEKIRQLCKGDDPLAERRSDVAKWLRGDDQFTPSVNICNHLLADFWSA